MFVVAAKLQSCVVRTTELLQASLPLPAATSAFLSHLFFTAHQKYRVHTALRRDGLLAGSAAVEN